MLFKKSPQTFVVKEGLLPRFDGGKYFYYVLEKKGVSTPTAVKLVEEASNARVFFSGFKDADSHSFQWVCSEKELSAPKDERIQLRLAGNSGRRIFVGMHDANFFEAHLEQATEKEKFFLKKAGKIVFPNYFDDQRFDENSLAVGNALLLNEFEVALKKIMTEKSPYDSPLSKKIKSFIHSNWGDWEKIADSRLVPENKKKVFVFLLADPGNFREALLWCNRRQLSIACRAIQAQRFNELLAAQISKTKKQEFIEINGQNYPIMFNKASVKRKIIVPAVFPKKKPLERKAFFRPRDYEMHTEGENVLLSFELRKGCYATILIKCLGRLSG
ncbi:MAG: tRNA pseudouridine(13) synthase TruD [Candidatus Diapherotrites archaeon]|nr:tRNA pseudouridine(13) synthase TruD [Candidatus Diapherotrites archaeon]